MLYVDLPSRAEVESLAAHRGSPAVSIYLRSTPLSQEALASRIELKNLLRTAGAEMAAAGVAAQEIHPIEEGVQGLIDDYAFWATQANSLAIFATPATLRTFRLPSHLESAVEVSDRFHIKPLLRAITFRNSAWVLVLGKGAARLVEIPADLPPQEIEVPGMPADLADTTPPRSARAPGRGQGDRSTGEGPASSAALARHARAVDEALRPVLAGSERPLIIAAAEPLASIFRSLCRYPHLAAQGIPGGGDQPGDAALAEAARRILDGIHAGEIAALAELYAARGAQGRATGDIAQAARAATFGAIDTLVVDMDAEMPGLVGDEDGAVTFAAAADGVNYSVTDEIARRALLSGARIVAARREDIPGGGALAAILRYPV